MRVAALLRQARRESGLGQRELARRAGVPQPTLSRIERGLASPRFGTLDRLLREGGPGPAAVGARGGGRRAPADALTHRTRSGVPPLRDPGPAPAGVRPRARAGPATG